MNWSWLLPEIDGIPVLMYHRVWPGQSDDLTITPEKLREQWTYLQQEGYSTLSLPQYLDIANGKTEHYPKKSLLITFDDGYLNNLTYAYPLLKEMDWKATFFIIVNAIDGSAKKEEPGVNEKMGLKDLKKLDTNVVQLGLHGYHHEHFDQLNLDDIKTVMRTSSAIMDESGLHHYDVLAYPYGARPKKLRVLAELKLWMQEHGIQAAFRIGNQVSKIPSPDIYEIKRIDITGTDTLEEFKIKLKKGKLKPF